MNQYQEIFSKVTKIIKKHGIPSYVKKWKVQTAKDNYITLNDFIIDLNEYVKKYHHHTLIFYKNRFVPSRQQLDLLLKHKKLPYYTDKPRRLPYMTIDKNKIGYIRFYQYYNYENKNKHNEWIKFSMYVKNKLDYWETTGLKGLIIDFRYHYGGSAWPIYYALSHFFEGSTLFAWTNCKAKHKDKVWMNVQNGNPISNQRFISKKLNVYFPIAIIIGKNTTSSGEVGAVMFYGRDNVKFFGQRTYGSLSGNIDFQINDKIELVVTTSLINTVNGEFLQEQFIRPDKKTNSPILDAKKWIISKL